jgi:PIN domain nuclease of toxin-antitoxin system
VRLLLDTHIWLWSALEPRRLTRRVAAQLGADGNELWLSPVSAWETLVLARKKRLVLENPPPSSGCGARSSTYRSRRHI